MWRKANINLARQCDGWSKNIDAVVVRCFLALKIVIKSKPCTPAQDTIRSNVIMCVNNLIYVSTQN